MSTPLSIAKFVHIWGRCKINIKDDVLIAAHVTVTSLTHNADTDGMFGNTQIMMPVVLEKNIWIGSGAIILPGVSIGEGSIVGAGNVVTHNVPSRAIVAGILARVRSNYMSNN